MKAETRQETRYRVQALERALDILDAFSFQDREMSLSDLAFKTGLNKTTAKRLVSNLVARGYLQQNQISKHYQLGMRLFELGGIVFSSFDLREAAAYPMTRLQAETGATVLLGTMMEDQLVYLDKREGRGMIRISSDIGWRRPLHYGMLGMVLMAFLDPKRVKEILEKTPLEAHTPFSITDEDAFNLRLEQIRRQGYIQEREEAVEGIIGIAAPIRNYSREVIAALGIALPAHQSYLQEGLKRYIDLVRETCDEISTDLGYLKI
ncbi:MAG: IclR family transcriptional regulator [Deltaproteobacteria bacterium]|nr:IclR family transcriptional regulator [Deltaproteobacteria bacterium]MBW2017544.1 IclR family transcriptional regulator [Deltaproteobacteria bacterium]MBW2128063.1 IclR family transcriptional regulator [Deltaproteobacteria bacterium]MBW2304083.1 IclR family transcriptional regulator [Deltaproteobacteria bacterium]